MAPLLSIYEAYPSRETLLADKPSIDLNYIIVGTSDDTVATAFVLAGTPDGLPQPLAAVRAAQAGRSRRL